MTAHNDDAILVHLEYIKTGIDELKAGQVAQWKQLGEHAQAIAVLEDRADESRKAGRAWGITAGGVGSAIGAALAWLFKDGR